MQTLYVILGGELLRVLVDYIAVAYVNQGLVIIIIIIISDIYIAQFLYEYTQLRITSSLTYYYPGFSRAAYGRS